MKKQHAIRYGTIQEFNVDWKAECDQLEHTQINIGKQHKIIRIT